MERGGERNNVEPVGRGAARVRIKPEEVSEGPTLRKAITRSGEYHSHKGSKMLIVVPRGGRLGAQALKPVKDGSTAIGSRSWGEITRLVVCELVDDVVAKLGRKPWAGVGLGALYNRMLMHARISPKSSESSIIRRYH